MLEITVSKGNITTSEPDPCRLELALQAMAQGWLSTNCAVATGNLAAFTADTPFPTEIPANINAYPRRWATFRGGRACARAALAELGVSPDAIPVGASGAPVWPEGCVGSISHTDEVAAAVVARSPPVRGIGLDIEGGDPLDDATMVRLVCRPEELVPGCDFAHPSSLRRGKLLFVVKEAVYKLYRPLANCFLDFHDLRVTLDESVGIFCAELVDPRLPGITGTRVFAGRYMQAAGFVTALAALGDAGQVIS